MYSTSQQVKDVISKQLKMIASQTKLKEECEERIRLAFKKIDEVTPILKKFEDEDLVRNKK